jgi:hypothetical protein
MQNAQNLMSSFEFIAALTSIIIGLGVTNLLAGARRAFYRRLGVSGETISRGERDDFLGAKRCAQRLIATHSLRARESATACTTRM